MGETSSAISGVVRDSRGQPVAGARVSFAEGPVPLPDIAALTGDDGSFVLSAPAPGTYRIDCYADGFAPEHTSVTTRPATPVTVAIRLTPGAQD